MFCCTAERSSGFEGISRHCDLDTVQHGPQVFMTDALPSERLYFSRPRCLLQTLSWSQQLLSLTLKWGMHSLKIHGGAAQYIATNDVSRQRLHLFETCEEDQWICFLPAHKTVSKETFQNTQRSERTSRAVRGRKRWRLFTRHFDNNSPAEVGSNCYNHGAENIEIDDTLPAVLISRSLRGAVVWAFVWPLTLVGRFWDWGVRGGGQG